MARAAQGASRYCLSFTAAGLRSDLAGVIAGIYLEEGDWSRTKAAVLERNALQARSTNSGKRLESELRQRLQQLSASQLELLAQGSDRPLGSVVHDIQRTLTRRIKLPGGYVIRYGGQFEAEERATFNLLTYSLLAAAVITLLMWMAVRSWPAALAIVINLPLALVGGLVAVVISGGVLSIASLVGFITLFGVAVSNGLLLVDNYSRRHASSQTLTEVLREGSLERLNAILMTALTSALGMLPLALALGAGTEILQPLAIVVLGGLPTSTLLTLVVLPALYAQFCTALLSQSPRNGLRR